MTTQNEPTEGMKPGFPFNCMAMFPEQIRDFIKLDLGPALEKAGYGAEKFRLFIIDDQRLFLPRWTRIILSDPEAARYVYGASFHWYMNALAPAAESLSRVHDKYAGLVLLSTEAATGGTVAPTPGYDRKSGLVSLKIY